MSQNMLVDRLKAAKRELTALKTVHRKGLGLLKVYTSTYTINPPTGSGTFWWLTIDFNCSVSAYPFVEIIMVWDNFDDLLDFGRQEFEYKNSGNTIEYRSRVIKLSIPYTITILSTSPINSMSYSWSS